MDPPSGVADGSAASSAGSIADAPAGAVAADAAGADAAAISRRVLATNWLALVVAALTLPTRLRPRASSTTRDTFL